MQRVPYLLVVGDREMEQGEIAVRSLSGEDLGSMKVDAFISRIQSQIQNYE
jgi:threonyl-tRNA synthetase